VTDAGELTWHTYVADAGYARRALGEGARRTLVHPLMLAIEAAVILCPLLWVLSGGDAAWLLVPVVVVALWLFFYLRSRARVGAMLPAGSVFRVALGTDALRVEAPLGSQEAPYGAVSRIRVGRQQVRLSVPSAQLLVVFPREALPSEVLDDLRERVRVATPTVAVPRVESGNPWPTDGVVSFTTDGDYVRRLTRAYHLAVIATPARIGTAVTLVALGVVAPGLLVGDYEWLLAAIMLVVLPLVVALMFVRQYRSVARRFAERLPVGTTLRAAPGQTSIWLDNPGPSVWAGVPVFVGETTYAAFDVVRVRGDFVFLRMRQRRLFAAFPAQLFPGPALADLTTRISAAAPRLR